MKEGIRYCADLCDVSLHKIFCLSQFRARVASSSLKKAKSSQQTANSTNILITVTKVSLYLQLLYCYLFLDTMRTSFLSVLLSVFCAFLQGCEAFSSSLQRQRILNLRHITRSDTRTPVLSNDKNPLHNSKVSSRNNVILYNSKDNRPSFQAASEQRGAVLLSLTLLLNVWAFSIPVELRRDHFCFGERCAANRSRCSDCVTFKEWYGKVKEYYANGGGVQFDFSVEEK